MESSYFDNPTHINPQYQNPTTSHRSVKTTGFELQEKPGYQTRFFNHVPLGYGSMLSYNPFS